jgi:ATP-dependent exoDNAse (exonuclease V) alpha subunit
VSAQAYVALSRARSLEGLRIAGAVGRDAIRAHPAVRAFYAAMREDA